MSIYKTYSQDQLEEHFSNFLINSWSYSKVSSFARNEKAFEMRYLYGFTSRISASTVAGQAYHKAVEIFFNNLKDTGEKMSYVELEAIAFEYIDEIKPNKWKIQKTTPTVEEAKIKANKISVSLLKNFIAEIDSYLEDIEEILHVESYLHEFVTLNGVDIPLPCNVVIDLVVKTKSGSIVIIDHKSKAAFTSEDDIALVVNQQATTYTVAYETSFGDRVDEVWFIENKHSTNKDGSPQLNCFKISMTDDARRLYEMMLYETVKRMIQAVSDPDYVYVINNNDNFVDKAEMYEHWIRTLITDIDEINFDESKKEVLAKRVKKIRDATSGVISPTILRTFKDNASKFIQYDLSTTNMTPSEKIEHSLRSFSIIARVAHEKIGYSSVTYLLEISAGVKIGSVQARRLDIANALDVESVRVSQNLVVHEGKSYLAIETKISTGKVLKFEDSELVGERIPIGKDNFGKTIVWDWSNHSTPHALVCGATGSGKSVLLRNIIDYSLLANADEVYILDPKHEFKRYSGVKNIHVYNEIEDIEATMELLVDEMNSLVKNQGNRRIVVIFDEFADALSNSRSGNELKIFEDVTVGMYKSGMPKKQRKQVGEVKSLEENLRILLQKGRSVGFRIVAATQRASVKVITGDSKVNFPVQICFRVPKETDSRVVLDEAGAESLNGMGDGLLKSPEYNDMVRFQAFFKS